MINYVSMFNALGKARASKEVEYLLLNLGDDFEVSFAPDNNDYYMSFKQQGISLLFDENEKLNSVFLYISPKEGFVSYSGWIGDKIENSFDLDQVNNVMGKPISSGGGSKGMFNMYIPVWCKYEYLNAVMHYQFLEGSNKIDMLTLSCHSK